MSMSWSHSPEAIEYARDQFFALPLETLQVVYAEWKARASSADQSWNTWFEPDLYESALDYVRGPHGQDVGPIFLAEMIWPWVEELCTCDNTFHNAWVCPWGCHTVPFGPEEQE